MPELPIYTLVEGDIDKMSLVMYPAVEKDFMCFAKEDKATLKFDDEKRNIHGVAMLADTPIYRFNWEYGEHYVTFSKELIKDLVMKFFKKHRNADVNVEHYINAEDITIFESFIISDRVKSEVFPEVPEGSWIVSYHVENQEVYDAIKQGKLKGFSIEGMFSYPEKADNADQVKEDVTISDEALENLINSLL